MTNQDEMQNPTNIEELLPWHAAGTLDPREAEQVEAAMAGDPELLRRFQLAQDEMMATVDLNEALGHPSPQVMTRLMAAIDAEGSRNQVRALGFVNRIGVFFASLTPRQLAVSAAAATLAIVLQAGLIGAIVVRENSQATYQTASAVGPSTAVGSFALVRFAPGASVTAVTAFLNSHKAAIVDGPKAGGLYRVKIAPTALAPGERNKIIAQLAADKALISFIVPAN